ncbi:Glycosyl hydrolase family 15 [Halalkaliarchaeum sp. AArc-CO]|uniref:glycoside hydrolase family 15 protein n=1 Tax=Halalkaliarchaeum sp. AArc-CO TaxID=2866381 RepID=UPI00217E8855|nr:glycoside hydrolase family 15 protein [Halalkaliarchaeum sp. AArc-CO]UWG49822.1 Glycosyl hydrolase family 15 [Halalkaliarchaeum sp. AArc-CO]
MSDRDPPVGEEREGETPPRFPGERPTTTGLFSGGGDRLVHVRPDGCLRDFGYPLSGLSGIDRARFALRFDDEVVRFAGCDTTQRYVDESSLVETVHPTPAGPVRRLDLNEGRAHLTRFDLSDLSASAESADDAGTSDLALLVSLAFSPDGRTDRVGQLRYPDSIEVYHTRESDFLAADPGFESVRAGTPAHGFEWARSFDGSGATDGQRYEEERLSRWIGAEIVPDGRTVTLVSLLTNRADTPRDRARDRLEELLDRFEDRPAFERAAAAAGVGVTDAPVTVPSSVPGRDGAVEDLRVVSMLSGSTGLRIAGPDFDPAYRHSGGYGYTWFRDDAEIAGFLLTADRVFDLDLGAWHRRSAEMYCRTQLPDGTWPHRVWPVDGSLAPGWANSRLETGENGEYQADQTASVVTFLARVRDRLDSDADGDLPAQVDEALAAGLDGLDATLAADGRPEVCQNAWEDAAGRFSHTAATFLEAYAGVAAATSVDSDLRAHAREQAHRVSAGIDDFWMDDRGAFAMRETPDGELDRRFDSASFALVGAHRSYDRVSGVDDDRLDRLVSHVDSLVEGLSRNPEDGPIEGLVRYEGDEWRREEQTEPKVWTVSTAWGANAATELSVLLSERDDPRAPDWTRRARELLALVEPGGPLAAQTGYLPEQFFDDGTPDSATPLGWPHAIRLSTRALLSERGVLRMDDEPVATD